MLIKTQNVVFTINIYTLLIKTCFIRRVTGESDYTPTDPQDLCNKIFVTCYMGTENSSEDTKARAKKLASQIGKTKAIMNALKITIHPPT